MITIRDSSGTNVVILGTNGEQALVEAIRLYLGGTFSAEPQTKRELNRILRYIKGDFHEDVSAG